MDYIDYIHYCWNKFLDFRSEDHSSRLPCTRGNRDEFPFLQASSARVRFPPVVSSSVSSFINLQCLQETLIITANTYCHESQGIILEFLYSNVGGNHTYLVLKELPHFDVFKFNDLLLNRLRGNMKYTCNGF